MSYMRGDIYIWATPTHTHFWVRRPEDSVTDWATQCDYANGVALDTKVLDEFVAMRWAELTALQRAAARIRAFAHWHGNVGCAALTSELGERQP